MAGGECDVLIVGAGTGGCAAAIAATSLGMRVIMTDAGTMIGGQLTSQMVPPDEHRWIEQFGCTRRYREYRNRVRARYGGGTINPGGGWVSRLCHTPADGLAVLDAMLAEPLAAGRLTILRNHLPVQVKVDGDTVVGVVLRHGETEEFFKARYVLDATELGDLLPLAEVEYRLGAESLDDFAEPHATEAREPDNVQGFTWCFAMGLASGSRPRVAPSVLPNAFMREYIPPGWPGPQLDFTFPDPVSGLPRTLPLFSRDPSDHATLFAYRQIVNGPVEEQATCVNWPQNDYFLGSVIDVPAKAQAHHRLESKHLSEQLLLWLQHDAPRHDGGHGYPELTLRPDISLTSDGFAATPYFRESRRMVTRMTVTEQMVSTECNPGLDRAPEMPQSVGVGQYRIDLHPSSNGRGYIDIDALPFQIPLGAVIPERLNNLLPACKNLGVTHITNGCYRLHPVEWNVGEVAGLLAAFCVENSVLPGDVHESQPLWLKFENLLHEQGIETAWPDVSLA